MREIRRSDDNRQATVTIILNDDGDVIGIKLELFKPIPIIDFNLDRLLMPTVRMRTPGFPGGGFPWPPGIAMTEQPKPVGG